MQPQPVVQSCAKAMQTCTISLALIRWAAMRRLQLRWRMTRMTPPPPPPSLPYLTLPCLGTENEKTHFKVHAIFEAAEKHNACSSSNRRPYVAALLLTTLLSPTAHEQRLAT